MATIHSLRIFIHVYKTGSITKAANALYLSQPAVSRCISDLEKEYNIILFERFHRRLFPTDAARNLYTYAIQITDAYDRLEHALSDSSASERIRIGSTVSFANTKLSEIISAYNQTYPSIRVEVFVSNGRTLQQSLIDNEIDLALMEDSIHENDLIAEEFMKDQLLLICAKNHPLSNMKSVYLNDLGKFPFLKREKGSSVREYTDYLFNASNVQIDTLWQSTSSHAIIEAVCMNIGISILPEKICEPYIKIGKIISCEVKDVSLLRNCYVAYHKDKHFTDALIDFKNLCLQYNHKSI